VEPGPLCRGPGEPAAGRGHRRRGVSKPIFLPGTVAFGQDPIEDGISFALTSPKNGVPHVVGRTRTVS
jgi:hypothetical protein